MKKPTRTHLTRLATRMNGRRTNLSLWLKALLLVSMLFSLIAISSLPVAAQEGEPGTPTETPAEIPTGEPTLEPTEEPTEEPKLEPTPTELPEVVPLLVPVEGDKVIPGQYIVVYKEGMGGAQEIGAAQAMATEAGGEILFTYMDSIEGFAAKLSDEALHLLRLDERIDYIEVDQTVSIHQEEGPSGQAVQLNPTWGLDRVDQRNLPLNNQYIYFTTASRVHVYVIDTGIRATHVEFGSRVRPGYTSIIDGGGTNDCNGHGTHVAGTIGGATYGIAKGVNIYPIRVLGCNGSGTIAGVIAGIEWVAKNRVLPAVANMSLGLVGAASPTLDAAVDNLISKNVTVVVAAGNENSNACNVSPARVPDAITVGATTSSDARSPFSNWGSCLDLFAPGSSITSAWIRNNTATATLSGTSMAAPHVAGAAALYLHANPNASVRTVTDAIISAATTNLVSDPGIGSPNHLLYSLLSACHPLQLDKNPPVGGEITPSIAPNCVGAEYLENTQVILTAKPAVGYRFAAWTGDLTGSHNPAELILNQPRRVTANFEIVPPADNDDFDNAIVVPAPGGVLDWWSDQRTISGATLAKDDPIFPFRSAPRPGSQTVWYRFTPHARGNLIVNTFGSDYDTILGIYRGERGNLSLVRWNDNAPRSRQSYRRINVLPGVTYHIMVASKKEVNGTLNIRFHYTPRSESNDAIRKAIRISTPATGDAVQRVQDIWRATTADTDPHYPLESGDSTGYRTVWYRFTPRDNGSLSVNTVGSNYDTLLGVFYGSWSAPVLHAWDDDSGDSGASQLETRLAGRATYWIGVASREESPQGSNLNFNFKFIPEEAVGAGSYPAGDSAFARLGDWENPEVTKIHSSTPGNLTSLTFTSEQSSQVTVHFDRFESGGVLRVLLNGRRVGSINQAAILPLADQEWSSRALTPGVHTLTLVHHSGAAVNLRRVTVLQTPE